MPRSIVIGGIESTFRNAQILHDLGEEIVMLYTRGEDSPGWEGVEMVDESSYSFSDKVPRTVVQGDVNEYVDQMHGLAPDFIWSLGWQQIFRRELLGICPVIGIHESLLPEGAGAVPIANAILHDRPATGVTLFQLDGGIDTGPIIGQLVGLKDPRRATATELYEEALELEARLLRAFVPFLRDGHAPRISQDVRQRTKYGKVNWNSWPTEKVSRARTYPYA